MKSICYNCGAEEWEHSFISNRCPKNGTSTPHDEMQEWADTHFLKTQQSKQRDIAPKVLKILKKTLKTINKAYDKEPIMLQKLGIDDDLIISLEDAIKATGQ